MDTTLLRIGDLAEQVGIQTSAVRFYESKGLLQPDARVAGQRRYSRAAVDRLRLVVMLRGAGLSCRDVAVALDRSPAGVQTRRMLAGARAAELRGQIATTLSALVVVEHASVCTRDADDDTCLEEIRLQREHALRQAQTLLAEVGSGGFDDR